MHKADQHCIDHRRMGFFLLAFFATIDINAAKTAEQPQRIARPSSRLEKFQP